MRLASGKTMKSLGIVALLAAVFLLLLFLDRFKFESRTLFMYAVRNFGHLPLFGAIAVILFWILQLSVGHRLGALPCYLFAWLGAVGLGAVSEYLQISTGRNADLMDWAYDIAGATSFLALYYSVDPRIPEGWKPSRDKYRTPVRIAALLIILGAGIPMITGAAASRLHRSSFPEMHSFENRLEKMFIKTPYAELEFTDPPDEWSGHGSRVARVTFLPAKYPGLAFIGPWPDWRDYQTLTFDVFSLAASPVSLNLMIKDNETASFNDRYNGELRILPGLNEIRILLSEIENAPADRKLDLSSVHAVHLFLIEPQQPLILYIDDLFLE